MENTVLIEFFFIFCLRDSTLRTTRILKDIRSDIKLSRLVCMGTSSVRRCVEICPDGFYGLQGKCKLCAVNCKTCTKSPLHCSSCRFPLYLKKNRCVKTCGSGYYGNVLSRNCTSCEGGCLTCVDGATGQFCISCKNGYILRKCPYYKYCVERTMHLQFFE